MSGMGRVLRSIRSMGRKPILDLDLNEVPISDSIGQEGPSNHTGLRGVQALQERNTTLPATIDLEADDDVIISSPRAFERAKYNRERPRVVDGDLERRSSRAKRRKVSAGQQIINLEDSNSSMRSSGGKGTTMPAPAPPRPPVEPTFSCPVCMGPLVEEMSTKCGHIFCKACIKASIAAQNKCPTCRKKITVKELIRIYLPATTIS